MLLGALGPIAAVQWRSGRWLSAARWIARNSTVHLLYATPIAGLLLASLGLSIMWPPGIVLAFLAAAAFLWALLASPYRRRMADAQAQGEAAHPAPAPAGTSGPFASRREIGRRTDRPRGGRRPQARRSRTGPAYPTRKDTRRAG